MSTTDGIRDECGTKTTSGVCGNDLASHAKGGVCLVMGCDCTGYTPKHATKPAPTFTHDASCVCGWCAERHVRGHG